MKKRTRGKRTKSLIVFLGSLLLIILVGTLTIASKQQSTPSVPTITKTETATKTPTKSMPTATSPEWKVYKNETYGYSIEYPEGSTISEYSNDEANEELHEVVIIPDEFRQWGIVKITVLPNPDNLTLERIARQFKDERGRLFDEGVRTTLDGVEAIAFHKLCCSYPHDVITIILVHKNQYIYHLLYTDTDFELGSEPNKAVARLLRQMSSTFRFTD